ncbi:MAG: hypothetical protein ACTSVU_09115 [Promethearchaeota archaeon]
MAKNIPEIIIFFIDLSGKILSKKDLIKNFVQFAKEKQKKIPDSTFRFFFYKKGDVPFLTEETKDLKELEEQIKNNWEFREIGTSFFENGLFYCLSTLAGQAVAKAGNYRVIVVSDTPSKKGSEYAQALMELVETIRNLPTFIDIIRVGESERYSDDVKLRIISTLTSGGLFYVSDKKEFKSTILGLAKNKTLPSLRDEGGQVIDEDKKAYYEKISFALVPVKNYKENKTPCVICEKLKCEYCGDEKDLYQCPKCGAIYHSCCAGLFSWNVNIGLKHIFRCTSCQALIKLDEELVYEINGEALPETEIEEKINETEEETWKPKKDKKTKKKVKKETEKDGKSEKSKKKPKKEKPKVRMGLFGLEYNKDLNEEKPKTGKETKDKKEEKTKKVTKKLANQKEPSKTSDAVKKSSARKRLAERRKTKNSSNGIRICKICSHRLKPGETVCPNCGSPAF